MSSPELRLERRASIAPLVVVACAFAVLAAAVVAGGTTAAKPAAVILLVVSVGAFGNRVLGRWEVLFALLVLLVLFVPIKRYGFPVSLPFDLEPYRVAIAILILFWLASLLADSSMSLRGSQLDLPLGLFALAVVASEATNIHSIANFDVLRSLFGSKVFKTGLNPADFPRLDMSGEVAKALLFLLSFFLVFYFVVNVVRTRAAVHVVLKTLVIGGAIVAVAAVVERRTNYNVFDHLGGWIPGLRLESLPNQVGLQRAGRLRVYASAQHPIALAALFVMLVPLGIYLAQLTRRRYWWGAALLLLLGALATVSRTSIVMLGVVMIVFLVLRGTDVKRILPLVLPALIVVHIAVPGAIGGLRQAFSPSGGLIQNQTSHGGRVSSRRLDPQFEIIRDEPVFGQGYGTRVTKGPNADALVLDDQWLGTAVETGIVGVIAWVWIFVRFLRRAGRVARRDLSSRGWLLTALAGSTTAFGVGMLTYDAFSFIQVTFILFVLLALGASVLASQESWPEMGNPDGAPSG
jgi:hypothetical protein